MSTSTWSVYAERYAAFLFDIDGTLLTSIAAAERVWGAWARLHGLDVAAFLPTIHGARAVDTIARLALPGVDPRDEALGITEAEIADLAGVSEVAGAGAFLRALAPARWAIVTSAPRALALRRLQAAGLPLPTVLITAENVQVGKPDPAAYLLAARRLGVPAQQCLVFEDAEVGIEAAMAAGARVMVVTSTHPHPLSTSHASIRDYRALRVAVSDDGMRLLAPDTDA